MATSMLMDYLKDYESAPNLVLNENIKLLQKKGQTVYNLAFGQSPFPVYENARLQLCKYSGEAEYLSVAGMLSLREEIARFHSKVDNFIFNPNNVIVGPGTKQLSYLLFLVFNGEIYLPSPCWTTYPSQAKLANKKPIVIQTTYENAWKITPECLEGVFSASTSKYKLLVLINPDNPTGIAYSKEDLAQLAAVFRKYNVFVLSDEIYGLVKFDGDHTSIYEYYPEGTILQSGISKWGSAGGWRLGYQVYPDQLEELHGAVLKACSHTHSTPTAPVQYAAVEYFRYDDDCQSYVKHCRRILKAVASFCYNEFSSAGLSVVKPEGTFYMMVDFEILRSNLEQLGIKTGVQLGELILKETKVGLMACGPAFLRPSSEFTFRVSYINFNGTKALVASRKIGIDKTLGDDFVQQYCTDAALAVKAVTKWVREYQC